MSEMRKNLLVLTCLVMGAVVTFMAFFIADKSLFISLATAWVLSGFMTLLNYYFGDKHKKGGGDVDV